MPRTIIGEMQLAGTSLLKIGSTKSGKDEEKNSAEVFNFNRGVNAQEKSTSGEAIHVDKPKLELPVLSTQVVKVVSKEEKNDLQALLRVRRFDLLLQSQGLASELSNSSEKLTSLSSGSEVSRNFTQQVSRETCESELSSDKYGLNDKNISLPLLSFTTVLKGQRVNLRGKVGSNKHRKQQQKTTDGNTRSYQTDSKSQEASSVKTKTSNLKLKQQSRDNMVSLKHGKQDERSVSHLPEANKYDIIPDRNHSGGKLCRVFRMNDLKTSLVYSNFKDSWVPYRDKYLTRYSVFKAILQQPTVVLRQPSPVAGVKMTYQEPEDFTQAAAIQAVEETNVPILSVDTKLPTQVKKFVVKLPPIC